MNDAFQRATADSYDKVAGAYLRQFQHELAYKAFDRHMLALLREKVGESGPICDMGCGPGHIAAYLAQLGAAVCGIDLSPQMVALAQAAHPHIPFSVDDMSRLDTVADAHFGGIAAFYAIIHIPRPQLIATLQTLRRVTRPGGHLLLTFHIGAEVRHLDTWLEQTVDLDFIFFEVAEMKAALQAAAWETQEIVEREPYPQEVATRRAYLFAQRPKDNK